MLTKAEDKDITLNGIEYSENLLNSRLSSNMEGPTSSVHTKQGRNSLAQRTRPLNTRKLKKLLFLLLISITTLITIQLFLIFIFKRTESEKDYTLAVFDTRNSISLIQDVKNTPKITELTLKCKYSCKCLVYNSFSRKKPFSIYEFWSATVEANFLFDMYSLDITGDNKDYKEFRILLSKNIFYPYRLECAETTLPSTSPPAEFHNSSFSSEKSFYSRIDPYKNYLFFSKDLPEIIEEFIFKKNARKGKNAYGGKIGLFNFNVVPKKYKEFIKDKDLSSTEAAEILTPRNKDKKTIEVIEGGNPVSEMFVKNSLEEEGSFGSLAFYGWAPKGLAVSCFVSSTPLKPSDQSETPAEKAGKKEIDVSVDSEHSSNSDKAQIKEFIFPSEEKVSKDGFIVRRFTKKPDNTWDENDSDPALFKLSIVGLEPDYSHKIQCGYHFRTKKEDELSKTNETSYWMYEAGMFYAELKKQKNEYLGGDERLYRILSGHLFVKSDLKIALEKTNEGDKKRKEVLLMMELLTRVSELKIEEYLGSDTFIFYNYLFKAKKKFIKHITENESLNFQKITSIYKSIRDKMIEFNLEEMIAYMEQEGVFEELLNTEKS